MDEATLRAILIPLHGAIGLAALVVGGIAIASPKRAGRHPAMGRVFFLVMLAAIAAATPVILVGKNLFLGSLGGLALYLTVMGRRLGALRSPLHPPTSFDHAFSIGGVVVLSAVTGFGGYVLVGGQMLGAVLLGLGGLGVAFARQHRQFLRAPSEYAKGWAALHGSTMGAAYIAGLTAFGAAAMTNYVPSVPEWIVWLAPAVVLTPVLNRMEQRVRQERPSPPAAPR